MHDSVLVYRSVFTFYALEGHSPTAPARCRHCLTRSYHMLPDSEHGISSLRLALERAFTPQTLANASNPGLSLVDCLDEKSASHRNVDLGIFFSFSFVCVWCVHVCTCMRPCPCACVRWLLDAFFFCSLDLIHLWQGLSRNLNLPPRWWSDKLTVTSGFFIVVASAAGIKTQFLMLAQASLQPRFLHPLKL